MKKKIINFVSIVSLALFLFAPFTSSAQLVPDSGGGRSYPDGSSTGGTIGCNLASNPKLQDLIGYVTCIISKYVVGLIFALAFVFFLWGVLMYVMNPDDEAKKDKGRQYMVWGIIGLTVMFCVWGLVKIVTTTFGVDTKFVPQLPQAPG